MLTTKDFEKVHKLYYAPLLSFAFSYCKDWDDAKDFVQDAFVRLWEAREISYCYSAKSYLFIGTKNRLVNYKRHLAVVKKTEKEIGSYWDSEAEYRKLQDLAIQHECYSLLYEGIQQLPPKRKDVIIQCLKYDAIKSRQEIANMLHIHPLTLKEHRAKAYSFLRYFCKLRFKLT